MKKLLILVILAALLCSISIPASAASDTYELDEVGLTVSIPADYWVITRDTPENSSVFSELGLTKAEMMEFFKTSDAYLNGASKTFSDEIVISAADYSLGNLSWFNDSALQELAENIVDVYTENGLKVSQYDIYQHHQTKFFRIYSTDAAQNRHSLQYYTIYDNKAISITMHNYAGEISADQEATLKTVVDSTQFGERKGDSASGEDTEPFSHTDSESGVMFTIPANWKAESISEGSAQFLYTKVDGYAVIYRCKDFWSEMTPEEKKGHTRADMDGSNLTYLEIALLVELPWDKFAFVTYNGMEYLKYDNTFTEKIYGVEVTFTVTQLIYIKDGWVHLFEFSGTSDHWLYADFEKLIESVKYPDISPETGSDVPNKEPSEPSDTGTNETTAHPNLDLNTWQDDNQDYTVLIVLGAIFAALGVVVAVIVHRKKKKNEYEEMVEFCAELAKAQKPEEKKILCRKCGHMLPQDSAFCHFCGTKVQEDEAQ